MASQYVDVAIVGLGPVGAALGNLLGGAAISVAIFEREAGIVPTPRAIALDDTILRVLETIGLASILERSLRPSTGGQYLGRPARCCFGARRPPRKEHRLAQPL